MPSLRSGITSGLGLCIRPYRYASQLVRRYNRHMSCSKGAKHKRSTSTELFFARQSQYVARQTLFASNSVASHCDAYSYVWRLKLVYFQSSRFSRHRAIFVSAQYRKILHSCITVIYMAIYFSRTIIPFKHVNSDESWFSFMQVAYKSFLP